MMYLIGVLILALVLWLLIRSAARGVAQTAYDDEREYMEDDYQDDLEGDDHADWHNFQEWVFEAYWQRMFPKNEGWVTACQHQLGYGKCVDFAAWRDIERAVGDAKYKETLTYLDVDQVIEYAEMMGGEAIGGADHAIIFVATDTTVPPSVQEYADWKDVDIEKTVVELLPR